MDPTTNSQKYANIKGMLSKYILCKGWDQRNLFALILVSYVVGFLISRIFVILFPQSQFWYLGLHLHHYYLGLIFLIIAVGIPLYYRSLKYGCISAILYGSGLGIYVDEIGLQITGGAGYWDPMTFLIASILGFIFSILALISYRGPSTTKAMTRLAKNNRSKVSNFSIWIRKMSFGSVLVSYLVFFSGARIFTVLFPYFQLWLFGYHLHHYYIGVISLVIAGGMIYYPDRLTHEVPALILFGSGVGLIINQVGELLTESDYWYPATWFFFFLFGMIFMILFFQQRRE